MLKDEVRQLLQKEIDASHIPGAVIQVRHGQEIVLEEALGYRTVFPEKQSMHADTVFDLASLTKVVATLPAILRLLDNGTIRLEDKIGRFLPSFTSGEKSAITLRYLLTHTSGYQAHLPINTNQFIDKKELFHMMAEVPLTHKVNEKVVYSDFGFALLFFVIEEITKLPFDEFTHQEVFKPLQMHDTQFNPKQGKNVFAATEYSDQVKDYKQGLVHDENTYAMGGISGHAGLFSTVSDLGKFAEMILADGQSSRKTYLSPCALRVARQNYTGFDELFRGIGWELNGKYAASCGDYFSSTAFGHTGFTGTSIWFDPEINLSVILLTNRVHYGRTNHLLSLRPRVHNVIRKYFN